MGWRRYGPSKAAAGSARLARRVLLAVYLGSVGALPVALGLWAYHPVLVLDYPPVYFTYSSVLVFAADGLAVAALISDLLLRLLARRRPTCPHPAVGALALLGVWAGASAGWSVEPRLSAYYGLHLLLVAGLAASLSQRPEAWPVISAGSLVGIGVQALTGSAEVAYQSTAFLAEAGLEWPGRLNPSVSGAAVVELADGTRWLRAYGTFPHPNLLATYLVGLSAGPVSWVLRGGKWARWGLMGTALTAAGLGLSFSRAAWLGFLVGFLWVLRAPEIPARRRRHAAAAAGIGFLVAVLPFWWVVGVRVGIQGPLEARSVLERGWLVAQAAELVRAHGPAGLGAGTFALSLRDRLPPGYRAEPAHNVGILLVAELGPVGIGLGLAVVAGFAAGLGRAGGADRRALTAALVGLLVVGMADHPLWTLGPGRVLWGLMLGAWVGQLGVDPGLKQSEAEGSGN